MKTFYDKIAHALLEIPGVEGVSAASALPLSGLIARTIHCRSRSSHPSEQPFAQHRWVGPGYFETMKIPIVRGRDITDSDNDHAPGAIIIDRALQRQYFGAEDPLGAHVLINMGDGNPPRDYEVVGVVEDVKHMGLTDEPMPTLYGPIPQAPNSAVPFMANNLSLVVRTGIEPEVLRQRCAKTPQCGRGCCDSGVRPMRQFLAASVAARRFNMELLGIFAVTALLLAAAGLYAVIAYLVSQRTREMGFVSHSAHTSTHPAFDDGPGNEIDADRCRDRVVGAIAVTRLMRSLLFAVAPTDLMTFGISAVVLIVVALLACFIPARRATKVDPLVALRYE